MPSKIQSTASNLSSIESASAFDSNSIHSKKSFDQEEVLHSQPIFNMSQYPDLPTKYELRQLLGEGAFSNVYKGANLETNEQVAIKVINKTNLSQKQLNNIQNEINIMNKLSNAGGHVNVLRLIESFESKENCFLILEFSDGGEIFNKIIEYTYFSEDLAKHVFLQLLDAIGFLHRNNVVHRDVKPENLLFNCIPMVPRSKDEFMATLRASDDESKIDEGAFKPGIGGGCVGTIKLADFGLAKQLRYERAPTGKAQSNLKTPCGTAGYTAPEVIHCGVERKRRFRSSASKSNFYSKAVDIWSLGCFLYTILCGFPPFFDENQDVLTHKIITADFVFLEPWWDEISEDVKDLISKMLVIDPEERITIDEIREHPWLADAVPLQTSSYFPDSKPDHGLGKPSANTTILSPNSISTPFSGHKSPGGILTPGDAIRLVFNNPVMSHKNLKHLANKKRQVSVADSVDPKELRFDEDAKPDGVPLSSLPRTPNPMANVNFKDVFDNEDSDDSSDDLSSEIEVSGSEELSEDVSDSEVEEMQDKLAGLNHLSISSTSSADSSKLLNNEDEAATRSSSVISGINGDYKFTLNLNDLNLLRRRSSVKGSAPA